MRNMIADVRANVNRRIGGLESEQPHLCRRVAVNRRIGGLEIGAYVQAAVVDG